MDELGASSSSDGDSRKPPRPSRTFSPSGDASAPSSVAEVFAMAKPDIDAIFGFYCFYVNPTKSWESLDVRSFSKFLRDIRVTPLPPELSPDLLFARVIKSSSTGRLGARGSELSRSEFETLLVLLADGIFSSGAHATATPLEKLIALLEEFVLPFAQRRTDMESSPSAEPVSATPEVKSLLDGHKKVLRSIFDFYSTRFARFPTRRGRSMNLKGFTECLQHHSVLGLLPRAVSRDVFFACADAHEGLEEGERELTVSGFLEAAVRVASIAYSQPVFQNSYDSLEKRVRKLLTKFSVLSTPKEKDFRGN